jgi:RNA 2',3'-cyclic 3'-phosphodiesterase
LRTFIAAEIPSEILLKIDKIKSYFLTQIPSGAVKWVDTQNLHLTLKFIGELHEEDFPKAKTLVLESLKDFSPFTLTVGGLGMFPNASRPRVIWLGIQEGGMMVKIHKALDRSLVKIGVRSEQRSFHPHLTIGRVRRNVDGDLVNKIGETLSQYKVGDIGTAQIYKILGFRSELTAQGPIYTSLFVVDLHQV